VDASQATPDSVGTSIERCAAALGDPSRLKRELASLRDGPDARASFAHALFQLELARKGDPEARSEMVAVASALLVFWRDGSGDELARVHPALAPLWTGAASMLISFEMKRFEKALRDCWAERGHAERLRAAMEGLQPEGDDRVEFARCLYHLELARLGIEASRAEFARRVGLLSDAYQQDALADRLVGGDVGLAHLWNEVKPYLDEFFEGLEEQASRRQESTRRIAIADVAPAEHKTDPSLKRLGDTSGEEVKTNPAQRRLGDEAQPQELRTPPTQPQLADVPPGLTPRAQARLVPSFLDLMGQEPAAQRPAVTAPQHAPTPLAAAPPPLTPPGEVPAFDIDVGPPPPPAVSGEVELIEVEEAGPELPPPPPRPTPGETLAVALDELEIDEEPDEVTLAFWDYTFATLQRPPEDGRKPRMLATESRADRKRLTTFLDGLGPHLGAPHARAFAALVRLMLAGETKEKSLFGQANPRRREALEAAFSMLGSDAHAAGQVAEWFVLDGAETEAALKRGLELLYPYVAFCASARLDPTSPEAVKRYFER
jgi:hypothetical protein